MGRLNLHKSRLLLGPWISSRASGLNSKGTGVSRLLNRKKKRTGLCPPVGVVLQHLKITLINNLRTSTWLVRAAQELLSRTI